MNNENPRMKKNPKENRLSFFSFHQIFLVFS